MTVGRLNTVRDFCHNKVNRSEMFAGFGTRIKIYKRSKVCGLNYKQKVMKKSRWN